MLNWKQRRSIVFISICILGMLILTLAGIFPNYSMSVALDNQINTLKQKIETQRIIKPVYKELLKRMQTSPFNGLDYPLAIVPATPKDIERFAQLMDEIAAENEMIIENITPDAESYLKDSASLRVRITLTGDFFNFRQLLIRLFYIGFVKEIESIRIHNDNLNYTYEMNLILAQKLSQ